MWLVVAVSVTACPTDGVVLEAESDTDQLIVVVVVVEVHVT